MMHEPWEYAAAALITLALLIFVEFEIRKGKVRSNHWLTRISCLAGAALAFAVHFGDEGPRWLALTAISLWQLLLGFVVILAAGWFALLLLQMRLINRIGREAAEKVNQGRIDEAIEYVRGMVRGRKLDGFLLAMLAQLYVLRGQFSEALAAMNRAIELQPDQPAHVATKTEVLLKLGQTGEAQQLLGEAIGRWPEFAPLYAASVPVLHELGRNDEALAAIRKVEKLLSSGRHVGMVDSAQARAMVADLRLKVSPRSP